MCIIAIFIKNIDKFNKINNKYYFNDDLFLEIIDYHVNNNIFYGKLYDLLSYNSNYKKNFKRNLIYIGMFVNYIPNGIGKAHFLWETNNNIFGIWLNGFILNYNNILKEQFKLNNKVNTYKIIDTNEINKNIYDIENKEQLLKYEKKVYIGLDKMIEDYEYEIFDYNDNIILKIKT